MITLTIAEAVVCVAVGDAGTESVAAQVAPLLGPGDLVALWGNLGAGKTTFTRGLARAIGSPAAVSSPTFTLIHVYEGGRMPIVHVDAYRLTGAGEMDDTGLSEYLEAGDSLVVIEWPERLASALPVDRLDVRLEDNDDTARTITITATGPRCKTALAVLREALGSC